MCRHQHRDSGDFGEHPNLFCEEATTGTKVHPKAILVSRNRTDIFEAQNLDQDLIFGNTLKNMQDGTHAKEIFNEQVKRGWPGLAKEATKICQDLELPNIIKERIGKRKWESMVKKGT